MDRTEREDRLRKITGKDKTFTERYENFENKYNKTNKSILKGVGILSKTLSIIFNLLFIGAFLIIPIITGGFNFNVFALGLIIFIFINFDWLKKTLFNNKKVTKEDTNEEELNDEEY